MSRSLIQTANVSSQTVAENSLISFGSTIRRYGCSCHLNGNSIEVEGAGYYTISGTVTLEPTAAGDVVIALQENGITIAGATAAATVATANDSVTLPIETTIRKGCNCDGASAITLVLTTGASTVTNVSLRVEKE